MGERGWIKVVSWGDGLPDDAAEDWGDIEPKDCPGVYLYTHWHGYKTAEIVREVLNVEHGRSDDTMYLGRILFDALTSRDKSEDRFTGFGLSAKEPETNYPTVVVVPARQEVFIYGASARRRWTFAEFRIVSDETLKALGFN
jgi:hypothetical protein